MIGKLSATIPQGNSRELYFLLTIKGHSVAYPIVKYSRNLGYQYDVDTDILVDHVYDTPILIPIKEKYTFGIRFSSIGYAEERNHKYRLEMESYDKVNLFEI